jgi:hypothetical protein
LPKRVKLRHYFWAHFFDVIQFCFFACPFGHGHHFVLGPLKEDYPRIAAASCYRNNVGNTNFVFGCILVPGRSASPTPEDLASPACGFGGAARGFYVASSDISLSRRGAPGYSCARFPPLPIEARKRWLSF